MTEIKIMSIDQLLRIPDLDNYRIGILLITTKPNYYNFGQAKTIYLDIADTYAPIIEYYHIARLHEFIYWGKSYNTIYVCCDAGLSRSPAVAMFLAQKIEEYKQAADISEKYRFLNQAIYSKLIEMIK